MAIKLKKDGEGIVLDKGLNHVALIVKWTEENIDIDIQAIMLKDGKADEDEDFVYYYNLVHPSGAIVHSGDAKKNGQEKISIILKDVPETKNEICLSASIDKAVIRGQHFGKSPSAVIELVDLDNDNQVIATYHPSIDLIGEICARLTIFKREGSRWRYDVVSHGIQGLEEIILDAGLTLQD